METQDLTAFHVTVDQIARRQGNFLVLSHQDVRRAAPAGPTHEELIKSLYRHGWELHALLNTFVKEIK